jgi:dihydrofolate synthase/folylpolyglutamate synthase
LQKSVTANLRFVAKLEFCNSLIGRHLLYPKVFSWYGVPVDAFVSADDVFAYLDRFISPNVWVIPKHLRAERLRLIAEAAGHPETCAPSFHIAGSKGKGSVTGMLTAMLEAAGKRAAQCVSPHVADVRERITLGGRFLDEAVYTSCGERVRTLNEKLCDTAEPRYHLFHGKDGHCYPPTYFELLTLYFFYCAEAVRPDVLTVETGMGGRFDPTNIVDPLVSVITVIELEHTAFLGNTIAEIAFEKAGIIKEGKPVVLAGQCEEALRVFEKAAREKNAPLYYLPRLISVEDISVTRDGTAFTLVPKSPELLKEPLRLSVKIPGAVQAQNAALAVAALLAVMPEAAGGIQPGLSSFSLPARFERLTLAGYPPMVIDGAHTALSAALAVDAWARLYGEGLLLFGCAEDKNAGAMAEALLPHFKRIIITAPGSYKTSDPAQVYKAFLKAKAGRTGAAPEITLIPDTGCAIAEAAAYAKKTGLPLFCTGSFYLAAAMRAAR